MANGKQAICCFVLGALLTAANAATTAELAVGIQLENATVLSCEPVGVTVLIENRGNQPVAIPAVLANPHYWLRAKVVGPRGDEVPYRGPEIQLVGTGKSIELYPGHLFGTKLLLDCESYDFSAPGEYTVSLTFGIGPSRRRDLESTTESNKQVLLVTAR